MTNGPLTSPQRLMDARGETHEYVVTLTDMQAFALRHIAHERVIRCKDCIHSETWPEPEGMVCNRGGDNLRHVDEDGFCAWAKPEEES